MQRDNITHQALKQGSVSLDTFAPRRIWVAYSGAPKGAGKIDKAPLNPKTGRLAQNNNPATWATREVAERRAEKLKTPGYRPGVGVQLGDLGDGTALCGVDLDGCGGSDLEPWAAAILERFNTYSEISPSGKGVKLFFRVRTEDLPAIRKATGTDHKAEWKRGTHHGAELHLSNSYFTVTGETCGATGEALRVVPASDVLWLVQKAGPALKAAPLPSGDATSGSALTRSEAAFRKALHLARYGLSEAEARDAMAEDDGEAGEWWNEDDARAQNRVITKTFARVADERARIADSFDDAPEGDEIDAFLDGLTSPVKVPAKVGGVAGAPMMQNVKPIINLSNAILYLGRHLDSILPDLRHNLMSGRNEWRDGPLTDAALTLARTALERLGLKTIGKELVADASLAVARHRQFHPIRDELAGLQHDGKPRLDSWLVRHLGADDTPYTQAVGRKFLLQMVARVMRPGCKADHTLVLSGPQGQGKSTVCRILAGADYFSDTLPTISGDKTDAIRHLQGKWLVELAELAPSRKSEAEDLKAFLSGALDRVRLPYARFDESFPRQCVFVGTTNEDQFLRDVTGGRRFWPVSVRKVVDSAALEVERAQLFAEAVAAYRAGEGWWLDRDFEAEHARPVQEAAHVADGWADTVADWLDRPADEFEGEPITRKEVTVVEVLEGALGVSGAQQSVPTQRRVADILKRLGWSKAKNHGRMVWRRAQI